MKIQASSQLVSSHILEFLENEPAAMLYHSPRYLSFIRAITGSNDISVGCLDDSGKLVGYFPLLESVGPKGRVVNSLPFYGSHGGILGNEAAASELLLWYREKVLSDSNLLSAVLVENPFSARDMSSCGEPLDERLGQISHIGGKNIEGLLGMCHSKTRNMIRKSAKTPYVFMEENNNWRDIFSVHKENMLVIGGKAKPEFFFSRLPEFFRPGVDYKIWTARLNNEFVAGLLVFYWKEYVEYFTPVVKAQHREDQALTGLIFHVMTHAAASQYKIWNWGGTWKSQDGVYRFKSRWGAKDIPYQYYVQLSSEARKCTVDEVTKSYPFFYFAPFGLLRSEA